MPNYDANQLTNAMQSFQNQAAQQNSMKDFATFFLKNEKNLVNQDTLNDLIKLLSLPDEQFNLLAPTFLDSLKQAYNDPKNTLLLIQALNVSGSSVEDVLKLSTELIKSLETEGDDYFSKNKRDFLSEYFLIVYNALACTDGAPKRIISIPLEKCNADAKEPTYAHITDAGMDVYALDDITIAPGETKLIPTGLKMAIPQGYEIQVRPKSGRCLKTKLRIANTPGTIDAGYRDEICVIVDNIDPPIKKLEINPYTNSITSIEYGSSYTIGKGEKFAQLVLSEVPKAVFHEVESVAAIANDGRSGGFGSTGL